MERVDQVANELDVTSDGWGWLNFCKGHIKGCNGKNNI